MATMNPIKRADSEHRRLIQLHGGQISKDFHDDGFDL
jgi:hypothetical protein